MTARRSSVEGLWPQPPVAAAARACMAGAALAGLQLCTLPAAQAQAWLSTLHVQTEAILDVGPSPRVSYAQAPGTEAQLILHVRPTLRLRGGGASWQGLALVGVDATAATAAQRLYGKTFDLSPVLSAEAHLQLNSSGTARVTGIAELKSVGTELLAQPSVQQSNLSMDRQVQAHLRVAPVWRMMPTAQTTVDVGAVGDYLQQTRGSAPMRVDLSAFATARHQWARFAIGGEVAHSLAHTESRTAPTADRRTTVASVYGEAEVLEDLYLGASAGFERYEGAGLASTSETYPGLRLRWTPSPRTTLELKGSPRDHGTSITGNFYHRAPRFAISAGWNSGLTRSDPYMMARVYDPRAGIAASFGALYDSLYQTAGAAVDPVARQAFINQMLQQGGVSLNPNAQQTLIAPYAQTSGNGRIALTWFGKRDTLEASAYRSSQVLAPHLNSPAQLAQPIDMDSKSRGAALNWRRELSQTRLLDWRLSWDEAIGLGDRLGEVASRSGARFTVAHKLSPKSTWRWGFDYSRLRNTRLGYRQGDVFSAFVGLDWQR